MTQNDRVIEFVVNKLESTVIRDYNHKVIKGNGIDSRSIAGQKLAEEDVLKLDSVTDKLDINDLTELDTDEIDKEQMKLIVESYISDLQKSVRILKQQNKTGLADEIEFHQIKELENLRRDLINN